MRETKRIDPALEEMTKPLFQSMPDCEASDKFRTKMLDKIQLRLLRKGIRAVKTDEDVATLKLLVEQYLSDFVKKNKKK